jgi:dynein heavy chain
VHSFYDDVAQNPQIVRAMLAVTHGIQKSVSGLSRVIDGWKVHQPLWKLDKGTVLDKFKARLALSPLLL